LADRSCDLIGDPAPQIHLPNSLPGSPGGELSGRFASFVPVCDERLVARSERFIFDVIAQKKVTGGPEILLRHYHCRPPSFVDIRRTLRISRELQVASPMIDPHVDAAPQAA
jgi:hypothetical protein